MPVAPPPTTGFAARLQAALIARIGSQRYHLWFPLANFVPMGPEVIVAVPNANAQDWLTRTFGDTIRDAAREASDQPALAVRFVVDEALFNGTAPAPVAATPVAAKSGKPPLMATATLFEEARPLPSLPRHAPKPEKLAAAVKPALKARGRRFKTLGEFVVGASNRVAHASALSVAEEPGMGGNPLVIHGPVGTGKTHLLEGIYASLKKQWPELGPTYVTAEDFTSRFVQASRFNKLGSFHKQFRDCGALLLDNLDFLATKKLTQEEFLHTFDALIAEGLQVVVTMDCHPRHADELMPELVDRLLGGAVWGLMPPDEPTRLDILRNKSTGLAPAIPEDVLKFLAKSLTGNVRELEGAVHSVRHYAKVQAKPVTIGLAREALGELLRHSVRAVTLADVDAAVCTVLHLNAGTLQSKARTWAVSHPRMLAIYLARKLTSATFGEIAKHFGVKTHSTPVAAEKKVREWVAKDAKLALGDREWSVKDLLARVERELAR